MSDEPNPNDEVRIFPPQKSLLEKIGVANMDEIFSPRAMKVAQDVIDNSADSFMEDVMMHVDELERVAVVVKEDGPTAVIASAFAIKGMAGLGGYDLVSELAKSLYLYCENPSNQPISQKAFDVIQWHVVSIRQMLKLKVKGKGGAMGDAIRVELARLSPSKV